MKKVLPFLPTLPFCVTIVLILLMSCQQNASTQCNKLCTDVEMEELSKCMTPTKCDLSFPVQKFKCSGDVCDLKFWTSFTYFNGAKKSSESLQLSLRPLESRNISIQNRLHFELRTETYSRKWKEADGIDVSISFIINQVIVDNYGQYLVTIYDLFSSTVIFNHSYHVMNFGSKSVPLCTSEVYINSRDASVAFLLTCMTQDHYHPREISILSDTPCSSVLETSGYNKTWKELSAFYDASCGESNFTCVSTSRSMSYFVPKEICSFEASHVYPVLGIPSNDSGWKAVSAALIVCVGVVVMIASFVHFRKNPKCQAFLSDLVTRMRNLPSNGQPASTEEDKTTDQESARYEDQYPCISAIPVKHTYASPTYFVVS